VTKRIGMLGGTFDPIHYGHLVLGETAREEIGLDRVILVPTGHSWRKSDREIEVGARRLEMLRLAVTDNPKFEVSSIEVEREGPSYSEITLAALQEANAGADLYFILGRDALADLPNWHDPRRIVELATLAVAERGDAEPPPAEDPALARLNARIVFVHMPVIGISATEIRSRVAAGRPIRYLTPDPVSDYIEAHALHRQSTSL